MSLRTTPPLSLPEYLLLLAIDDKSGKVSTNAGALNYGLAGAVLIELATAGAIASIDGKIRVGDSRPLANGILDDALARIVASTTPRDARGWIRTLASNQLRERLTARLVGAGILRASTHRMFRVIPSRRYPAVETSGERLIRDEIRIAVLVEDSGLPDSLTAALIALLKGTGLLGMALSRNEQRYAKLRIEAIANAVAVGDVVGAVVRDAATATAVAVSSPTAMSAISS